MLLAFIAFIEVFLKGSFIGSRTVLSGSMGKKKMQYVCILKIHRSISAMIRCHLHLKHLGKFFLYQHKAPWLRSEELLGSMHNPGSSISKLCHILLLKCVKHENKSKRSTEISVITNQMSPSDQCYFCLLLNVK